MSWLAPGSRWPTVLVLMAAASSRAGAEQQGGPDGGAPDRCQGLSGTAGVARWRLRRGKEIEVCAPADWVPNAPGEPDGFQPPPSARSDAQILFVEYMPPRDTVYDHFDEWLRTRKIRGRPTKVGTLRALREPVRPGGGGLQESMFIAVPYANGKGGIVEVFSLAARADDPHLADWRKIYDQMARSLRLLETTVPNH